MLPGYFYNWVVLLCCCVQSVSSADSSWDYQSQGADWGELCKTGKRQSPIHLSKNDAVYEGSLDPVTFKYSKKASGNYSNNGHSISFSLEPNAEPSYIEDGSLNGKYQLAGWHFHWGSAECEGSEHVFE